jgi:ankyrin repeat protein
MSAALHAAMTGQDRALEILIEVRADLNLVNDNGWAPIHAAANMVRSTLFALNCTSTVTTIRCTHGAGSCRCVENVDRLNSIYRHADLYWLDCWFAITPTSYSTDLNILMRRAAMYAASNGHAGALTLLSHAGCNLDAQSHDGNTLIVLILVYFWP